MARSVGHGLPTVMRAYGKVNLYLGVGAPRGDGYHDVSTVMQSIGLSDEVWVQTNAAEDRIWCNTELGMPDDQNIAWKAVQAYRAAFDEGSPVAVDVRKAIPAEAGLGGGSADGAAVLTALAPGLAGGLMEHTRRPDPALLEVAGRVGSDVPFFLGAGTQLLGGRGDLPLETLPTPSFAVVVLKPEGSLSTSRCYEVFDTIEQPPPPGPEVMVDAVKSGDVPRIAENLYNNMTEAAMSVVPEIGRALDFLRGSSRVMGSTMCGSGSAVFGICESYDAAHAVAIQARSQGWWSTSTVSRSASVEWVPIDF